ncbi:hypothetical protein LAZ67_2005386 [Cordylochernes scorpioides]|uniref:Mos1 transposase HTH domain-containing protein n=1 Tax=Cordylochernes scorpioides TaxID=51811 RepID=A0ABY6K573_9ARAC|nr:hypothetical protein LAZ67_2005386 [Cordylochernes scorpioides]
MLVDASVHDSVSSPDEWTDREVKQNLNQHDGDVFRELFDPTVYIQEKIFGNTMVPISRRYVRARQSYSNLFKGYTLRCGDFTMEQKLKQRICIEFCVKLQISATDTFEMLNKEFPNNAPKRTTVFEWHSRFKAGRISIEDDPRQGRPTFQRTDENMQKITDLIKENPRTTLLEQDTGISKTTIGRIVTEDLRLKKTPAKFIPRFLTNEQKLCRLATCEDMLEMTRTDPEWKDKIITGDETWVYGYDPETKRQSAEWRGQGEPRPKKSRILKSRNKVLLVAFLDNKGIVHHEYLPAGQTVIKEMYLSILRRLREAIRKKRPEKWTNGDWILHHDNARPHTAHLMTSFLAKNGTEILPQPPYSPDIAPNDFFLFPKLKAVLKGRHFDTREDIIEKSLLALKSIPKEAYKNCFGNWEKRWRWIPSKSWNFVPSTFASFFLRREEWLCRRIVYRDIVIFEGSLGFSTAVESWSQSPKM